MRSRKYKMRLNGFPDADLITLKDNCESKFSTIIADCLRAYVRNEDYEVYVPEYEKKERLQLHERQLFITLKEDADADVIEWINSVGYGYRNIVFKSILRSFLSEPSIGVMVGNIKNATTKTIRQQPQHNNKNNKSKQQHEAPKPKPTYENNNNYDEEAVSDNELFKEY